MHAYRRLTLATALLGLAVPALAQVYESRTSSFGPPEPRVVTSEAQIAAPLPEPVLVPLAPALPDAIHSGAGNSADEALADSVAAAIAADSRMHGATVTVSASNGNVSLSGSARTPEQAGHAENIARRVAGVMSVSGTLASQGG